MATKVIKHDTAINWSKAVNFTPKLGEIIVYDDLNEYKIGDGKTKVNFLPFVNTISVTYKDLWELD